MTTDAVTHEVISDVQAFRALEPEWNALWHKAKGEHFQTFAYCHGSHGSLDATVDGRKLQCVVGRRQGRLMALWPLVMYRNSPALRSASISPIRIGDWRATGCARARAGPPGQ